MSAVRKNVLLVGLDRGVVERVVPLLKRREIDVLSTEPSSAVLNLVQATPFDLLVVRYPLERPTLETLLEEVRSPESYCRTAGIILVAEDPRLEEAQRFEGMGVNRIMAASWTEAHLWRALSDLLQVAPRASLRTLAHLQIRLGRERQEDLARSVNLSATGVLLEAPALFRPGTPLHLTFRLPEELRPVKGRGEVVRVTEAEREEVDGFAVRFLSLEEDGAERVGGWVAAHR